MVAGPSGAMPHDQRSFRPGETDEPLDERARAKQVFCGMSRAGARGLDARTGHRPDEADGWVFVTGRPEWNKL
jgi:hypothetical protein